MQSNNIKEIADQILSGGVGIFPFDTIFGLTGLVNQHTIQRIADIKQRPYTQPFLFVFPNQELLMDWIQPLTDSQNVMLSEYWPGSVTFVLPKADHVASGLVAGKLTIAARCPDFAPLQQLFTYIKQPLISTSVNFSGELFIKDIDSISVAMRSKVDFVYKYSYSAQKQPSTMADLTTKPFKILRQGDVVINSSLFEMI
ncbi:hypothetical protein DID76_02560 [Candidatus Marinamargulisbacteria bacterium SCGC AG-414-C22]|nr:hypothetical protein DID76_02560 [Candidatus Marinamargulisbacteria bacterium SCGC AG-414-C22]